VLGDAWKSDKDVSTNRPTARGQNVASSAGPARCRSTGRAWVAVVAQIRDSSLAEGLLDSATQGVARHEGHMVDEPVLERARTILATAALLRSGGRRAQDEPPLRNLDT
jgi:hypothetical protein